MNLISFANFNISDNQTSLLPAMEKDGKPEDFSSILNTIFVALQTANSAVTNFSGGFEKDSSQSVTVSEGGQNVVLSNNQILSENSLGQNSILISNTENFVSIKTNVNPMPGNAEETNPVSIPQTNSPDSLLSPESLISIPENFQPLSNLPTMQTVWTENQADENLSNIPQTPRQNDQTLKIELPVDTKDFEILSVSEKYTPQQNFPFNPPIKSGQNTNLLQAFKNISNSILENDVQKEIPVRTDGNPNSLKEIRPDTNTSIEELIKANLAENKSTSNNPAAIQASPISKKLTEDINALPKNEKLNQSQNTFSSEVIQTEKGVKIAEAVTSQNFNFSEKPEKELKPNETENNLLFNFENIIENAVKDAKVAETNLKNQTESAKITEQINPHLLELASLVEKTNEKEILKLRLHPADLGTVEITLEKNSSGMLNAHFKTETEGAKQALSNGLEQLRDILQNAGWNIGQLEITNGSSSTTDNQHRQNNQPKSEWIDNFIFNRSSEQPDETENNSPTRLLNLLA